MAPYKVAIIPSPSDAAIELVVPAREGDLTVASLVKSSLSRANKRAANDLVLLEATELRLNSAAGYHIDADDKIADILTPDDVLFVILETSRQEVPPIAASDHQKRLTSPEHDSTFQIRVITPSTAVQQSGIPPSALIRDEHLFATTPYTGALRSSTGHRSDEDQSDIGDGAISYKRYRVLKVELAPYIKPEDIEEDERRRLRMFTRMAVSKQVFNAFINRLIAYNFPTTVGLVTSGSTAILSRPLTDVVENFRTAIEKISPDGETALWDAVHLAADQLIRHRKGDPNLKCRIICLSDGCDTNSIRRVEAVCQNLLRNNIVLDSVSIGIENNLDLRTVSYTTGGYAFVPQKLEDAVGICELEPVLSQHERPPLVQPISSGVVSAHAFRGAFIHANPTPFTRHNFPARKSNSSLLDAFVKISALQGRAQNEGRASDQSQGPQSGMRTCRLLTEIRDLCINPHPSYNVFISETNMGFWKIVLAGPAGSAYEGAAFVLYLDMPEEYPRVAPKGRFVTPIFHPNISRHGLICHSIFDRNWTTDTTVRQVLDTVFGLLLVPEFSEPINTTVILAFYWDEIQFRDEVRKHIRKFAKKNRAEILE